MVENIQRWEDDGGGIVDELTSTTENLLVQPTSHDQSTPRDLPEQKGESHNEQKNWFVDRP